MWQNEVGEPREGAHNGQRGGGSSTLPQKSNPVRSEAVLSLARHAAGLVGQLQLCAFHQHERDGVAWQLEWLLLPQMLVATGAALRQRSEEHTSELQSLMRISYAVFCLKKKNHPKTNTH